MNMSNMKIDQTRGPVIALGTQRFSVNTETPAGKSEFNLECFRAVESESSLILEYNGMELQDFGVLNDFYGFGSSPKSWLDDAHGQKIIRKLKDLNADLHITATLVFKLCFLSDDQDAYCRKGTQNIFHVPFKWRSLNDLKWTERKQFRVWQNGEVTPETDAFFTEIEKMGLEDTAPNRNGRIFPNGNPSTPRDEFHAIATELAAELAAENQDTNTKTGAEQCPAP